MSLFAWGYTICLGKPVYYGTKRNTYQGLFLVVVILVKVTAFYELRSDIRCTEYRFFQFHRRSPLNSILYATDQANRDTVVPLYTWSSSQEATPHYKAAIPENKSSTIVFNIPLTRGDPSNKARFSIPHGQRGKHCIQKYPLFVMVYFIKTIFLWPEMTKDKQKLSHRNI